MKNLPNLLLLFLAPLFSLAQILPIDPCIYQMQSTGTRFPMLISDCDDGGSVSVSMAGPSTANVGDFDNYYLNVSGGGFHSSTSWGALGGTIVDQTKSYARVRWDQSGSSNRVTAGAMVDGQGYLTFKVVSVSGAPPTPSSITVSTNTCGNKTLTRSNPPTGITWYWQTSSSGKSTSNSSLNYTLTSSGTRYLRARNNTTGEWSISSRSSGSVTVNPIPSKPLVPGITQNCGSTTINNIDVVEANHWYWQGTNSNGTSTLDNSLQHIVTESGTYYLRARSSAGCWSASRAINVTVNNGPPQPTISSITYGFDGATVTRNNPPSGVTWYWHTSVQGESQSNSSQTYLMTEDKNYYLRGIDDSGCWGENLVIPFLAKEPDVISASTESYNSIRISWSGVKGNETGFLISRSQNLNGNYTPIHTANSTDTEFIDGELEINSTWYYRVQAIVGDQKSTGLQIVSASTETLTYIPDQAFWGRIIGQHPETALYKSDGQYLVKYVKTSAAEQVTHLNCARVFDYEAKIYDITGIEDFTSLEWFNFHRHDILSADISENSNLRSVNFPDNPNLLCIKISEEQLSNPDISWNVGSYTSLTTGKCDELPKTEIPDAFFEQLLIDEGYDNVIDGTVNTDKITNVEEITLNSWHWVQDITGIEDFSSLRKITYSNSTGAGLVVLPDFSSNENLVDITLRGHLNLECIKVNPGQLNNASILWNIDGWLGKTTGNCDLIPIDDKALQKTLFDHGYLWGQSFDEYISVDLVETITELNSSNSVVGDIAEIEFFTSLESFDCTNCRIGNDGIAHLSVLPNLHTLNLSGNDLNSADFSNFQSLKVIDVSNQEWLTCIQLSEEQMNDPQFQLEKDIYAGLSLDCANQELTYVPGTNFEVALRNLGYDKRIDDYIPTDVINKIEYLSLSNKNIYNLTGIEDFASLEFLDITSNAISELDLSNNLSLTTVWSYGNLNLTCIKTNQNQLSEISWYKNSYTGLTTDTCEDIFIPDNVFEQKLIDMGYDNRLDDYVSLSTIEPIVSLNLHSAQINSLQGIEGFKSLEHLYCGNNYITELDISNNLNLVTVNTYPNTYLDCIQVNEDQLLNYVNSWYKDDHTQWSLDCSTSSARTSESQEIEDVLASEDVVSKEILIYPNPANENITLSGDIENSIIRIFDLNGREVYSQNLQIDSYHIINTSKMKDGIYLLKIEPKSGEIEERKLIIKH